MHFVIRHNKAFRINVLINIIAINRILRSNIQIKILDIV